MRNELDIPPGTTSQSPTATADPAPPTPALSASLGGTMEEGAELFLARVSEILNSSLDYRETVQSLARLCAGFLAEYCIVHVSDAGEIRALGIAHTDITREPALIEVLRLLPIGLSSRNPVVEVLRTGLPCLMPAIGDAELESLSGSNPHGERLRELGLTSAVIMPLTARGATLGAISLARTGDAPPYTERDVVLLEELARRAALAVDNARLYREARREAKARERTLGVVSHDLRNALNAALIHSDLLVDFTPEQLAGGAGRKQVLGLRRTLGHMQRLVQDLLDVENIENGRLSLHLAALDLRLLRAEVEELFAPLAQERGVELTVELPEAAGREVRADHVRIVQVLANLVTNALDFTPSGGRVSVYGGGAEFRDYHIRVEDTGVGIAEADLPHVFDRHWRGPQLGSRSVGSGLGLTIVRGIVQAHGGESWVESVTGCGSTFHFTLPTAG